MDEKPADPTNLDAMLQAACAVPVERVAGALGIELLSQSDGRVRLARWPEVLISGPTWKHAGGKTGPAGLFRAGNAVHLAIEYGGMSLADAVRAVVQAAMDDHIPARTGFRRRSGLLRLQKQYPAPAFAAQLPPAASGPGQIDEALSWLEARGISRDVSQSLLEADRWYRSAEQPEIIFAGAGPDGAVGGMAYPLAEGKTIRKHRLDHASPLCGWVLPAKGDSIEIYGSPLELMAAMRLDAGEEEQKPSRLALFPSGETAALAYVLTHGEISVVHLCFGRREKDRAQMERLRTMLTPYAWVRCRFPPEPHTTWREAAEAHASA